MLLIGPGAALPAATVDLALLRKAVRTKHKLALTYRDGAEAVSDRIIWKRIAIILQKNHAASDDRPKRRSEVMRD